MLEKLLNNIEKIDASSVRFRKGMDEIIQDVSEVLLGWGHLSAAERKVFDGHLSRETGAKLLAISCRFAEKALDTQNTDFVDLAVLSHIAEGFRSDYRENYRYLVVADHAARRLGYSLQDSFAKSQNVASERTSSRMMDFFARDPDLNQLSVFGLAEKQTPDGVHISAV
ncbi:hypothetical protein [Roseobacter weihaiensis]|uniref:hypothetical protein n=1 Tax=Roseobacter weihaiensis TaxID=2763262 RepID=UPI001D0B2FC5|nr:hypothetical protein [Roseobacter sp. H9]